jgi:hypothetical protein
VLCQREPADPFSAGSIVVVTLGNPRDKFWGMVLALRADGLSLSGIELASFEDLVLMVKEGESLPRLSFSFPCTASNASNSIFPMEICRRCRSVSPRKPDSIQPRY